MEEIKEVATIVRFLTKQNVSKDMQNEILEYYHSLQNKKKVILVYMEGTDYCRILQSADITKFNIWNFIIYLEHKTSSYRSNYKIINEYKPEIIKLINSDLRVVATYSPNDLLKILEINKEITNKDISLDLILNKPDANYTLKWKYIEI